MTSGAMPDQSVSAAGGTAAAPDAPPVPAASATPATAAPATPAALATPDAAATPAAGEASVTSAPSPSNPAKFEGCPIFTADDYYNANISHAAADPHSANYIAAARAAGNTSGFRASTGAEFVNIANSSTPRLAVHPDTAWHVFANPYPWGSSFRIEPAGDRHAIVLDTSTCHLYEADSTVYSGGRLSAYSSADWSLTQPFRPPASGPSAMASGLSIFAGMVKWEEVQSGAINHALNWEAPAHTFGNGIYMRPASNGEAYTFNGRSYALPYGAHLRLKASFDISNFPPQAKIVAQAMKVYGIYLSDTGSNGNGLYFANALDGTNPWDGSDLSALGRINISDFDVLPISGVRHI
ncbi:MAG: hypothetical protein ACXWNK_04260 [Vulcanimicrobiaceae bacterium]